MYSSEQQRKIRAYYTCEYPGDLNSGVHLRHMRLRYICTLIESETCTIS